MAVWDVQLSELDAFVDSTQRGTGFDVSNPRYCLNMIQASHRWAEHNNKGVGYPSFVIQNGVMKVMGGIWSESLGSADRHNTFQDIQVSDLVGQVHDMNPNDFSSAGVLKWARATNLVADQGRIDNGSCAVITGEYLNDRRGSEALRTRGRANAKGYYQAIFEDIPHSTLQYHDSEFETLGWRFDIWTRSICKAVFARGTGGQFDSWAFPNYQEGAAGHRGAYIVLWESSAA